MKRVLVLLLALCLACMISAASAETEQLTKIVFCLDWTPNTNHTGVYAAQALGYYKEAGLDVEIVQPPENGAVLMCAAGQAQFAVDAQDTMAASLDLDEPLGVTAVAALLQHNTSGILSRAEDGITSAKGLENRVYATWDNPIELAMLRYCMEKEGGDFSKVRLIPNNVTDEPAALAAHQIDAVWIFYGWSGINAELSDVAFGYWDFASVSSELDYYTPVLLANNDFLEQNPETARAFLKATERVTAMRWSIRKKRRICSSRGIPPAPCRIPGIWWSPARSGSRSSTSRMLRTGESLTPKGGTPSIHGLAATG